MITVSGTCPGAGKSTLSAALAGERSRLGFANRLLTEDQLLELELFGRFDWQLGDDDPLAIETLLDSARTFVADSATAKSIFTTDALLPGFMWLLGRYPFERVERFAIELSDVLWPLHPRHVYLSADPASLFARAVAARGTGFRDRMMAAVKRWHIPHYPGGALQSEADVLLFFAWLDQQLRIIDARTPLQMVFLDATAPIEALLETVLGHT
jgi:hypothetical protein